MLADSTGELRPGDRLGPYEIVAPLGAGGMGEVWRARDSRLGREVAIKVLPAHLTEDRELRVRFEREARSVAALNHPHICTLYDVGREGDREYLVMELLEGETLAARLARGALPITEVLRFGTQITDALDRAHRQGLIHRDLKPGNIMLTRQGAKLLDFGLARPATKAVTGTPSTPTMSGPLTASGLIVGTFQYLAPEQLEGGEADTRSDLWALGTVLYQMATGRAPFEAASQARLLVAILTNEPKPISELVPLAPPALDRLVRACLAKDPDERIQTAHDVKLQLQWITEGGSQAGVPVPVAAARRRHERTAWLVAAAAVVAAIAIGAWALNRPEPRRQTFRFEIQPPHGNARDFHWPRLSPDGTKLAYLASDSSGMRRILVRRLDSLDSQVLAGTEDAGRPFWSPDGSHLAFMVGGKLKKIPAAGGPLQLIVEAPARIDGSWGKDVILLDGGSSDTLLSVSPTGGQFRPASQLDPAYREVNHAWPSFLPDGRTFLFTAHRRAGLDLIKLGRIGSFDASVIDSCDSRVEYVAPGYLLYARAGTLYARRFDVGSGTCRGEALPVAENLGNASNRGDFSGSLTGTIAYRANVGEGDDWRRIVVVDRSGRVLDQIGPDANYRDIALSPDGTRLIFSRNERSLTADLWMYDLRRGTTSRLTFDPETDIQPVWSPDGRDIAFTSPRDGQYRIYMRSASGVGADRKLPGQSGGPQGPVSWSRALGRLGVMAMNPDGTWDVEAWVPGDTAGPVAVSTSSSWDENQIVFSPDGRWVAYTSLESGRPEVYVQSYPDPSSRYQVSVDSGRDPEFRADGREFFYRTLDDTLMAVPITIGETFEWGTAKPLFLAGARFGILNVCLIDAAPDGQRFYILREVRGSATVPITVVTDWVNEVERGRRR